MSSCLERGGERAHRHTAAGESATTSRILLALPQWAGRSDRVTPPMYTNLTCSGVDQFLSVGVDHFPNVANRADRKLLPVKRVMHYRGLSARRPGPAHRRTLENTALIKKYYPGSPDFGVFLPWPRFGSSTSGSFVHPSLGAQGGPLQAPSHLSQDPPDMARMVAHGGRALDHLGHPWQGPQIGGIAVCCGAFQKFFLDLHHLLLGKSAFSSRSACPVNCLGISVDPVLIPAACALTANLERSCNSSLPFPLFEQGDSPLPSFAQRLKSFRSPLHRWSIS
jgi:hypothetical protein